MLQNQRFMACALLLGICAGATAGAAGQSCDPGEALKDTVQISAGGPYDAKAGSPITLHGTYVVDGQSVNTDHLKIIGQALEAYALENGSYPPAALLNDKGQPTVSWRVLILPYLGHKELYERFDLSKPWNDPANLPLLREMPGVYRKGGAAEDTTETGFAGVEGFGSLFQNASAQLDGGRQLSGVTVTEKLAAGPVGAAVHLPWTAPGDIDNKTVPRLGSPHGFSGEGCAVTPLLFLDGSVHLIPDQIAAGPIVTWTQFPNKTAANACRCSPPSSVDVGLHAVWDLGKNGTFNTEGWNVTFQASQAGTYTVTLRAYDHFCNEFKRTTTVDVR